MSPLPSHDAAANSGLREVAYRPRDSDGVGNALRQIFGGAHSLPSDFRSMLNQLNTND